MARWHEPPILPSSLLSATQNLTTDIVILLLIFMRYSLVNLVALALCIQTANARLFPTQPIAKTVFRGGAWNNVTWRDSDSKPSLAEMGEMRLELWVGDSVSG